MIEGIWSAVLTPIDADLAPDTATALSHCRELLERGCDGVNLLGTTGEAMSFSVEQRVAFMEAMAANGLPMRRAMAGTGAASLSDAVRLTRCAFACGFAAALVMPPFFYRDACDDGIVAFFDVLLAQSNAPPGSVLLYNFPRMSGVAFHPDLVDRLLREFPGVIAGIKDSSNDPRLQAEVLARHRGLAVLPGSESDLLEAKARGASGCISGSVALWPRLAHEVFVNDDHAKGKMLQRTRAALDGLPFIPAVRYLSAALQKNSAWQRMLPPLVALTTLQREALERAIEPLREVLG
jgi:4-hydroxy-tetrahydrodipicolinate synthase